MDCFWMFWASLLVDTAKMLPFLFLAYLLIQILIETRHGERIEALLRRRPLGARFRAQCWSCAAVRLFSHCVQLFLRVITLGTLMAVYLAYQ